MSLVNMIWWSELNDVFVEVGPESEFREDAGVVTHRVYLTQNVLKVVLQKSTPPEIVNLSSSINDIKN